METTPFVEYRPQSVPVPAPEQLGWSVAPKAVPHPAPRAEEADFPEDLAVVSTRQLRVLCNQTYRQLDRDFPPMEAIHQYEQLVEEIERREVQAEARTEPVRTRSGFRDNALFSRFELFSDGTMVGHVKYEMKGSHAVLVQAVVDPRFDAVDVEPALIRQVFLNAHRRRLAVVPYCPRVREFLAEFPQYRSLLPADQRRRFEATLRSAGDD
ncbi:N-acetyltransferase [Arthrobacter agilis]|uniref:GNAT family N-acetyltransferase n=1 Tax=Arthrobacter agilis TaxID=37921 RepID=UPI002366DA4D|nr:N-acetyltransferase [Arthrobacter agilis]WDF33098.1 N-acetyltransferase [Arthrobacter agilis]